MPDCGLSLTQLDDMPSFILTGPVNATAAPSSPPSVIPRNQPISGLFRDERPRHAGCTVAPGANPRSTRRRRTLNNFKTPRTMNPKSKILSLLTCCSLLLPLCGTALAGGKGKENGEPGARGPFNHDKVSRTLRERKARGKGGDEAKLQVILRLDGEI